jgi:hypothetical protein
MHTFPQFVLAGKGFGVLDHLRRGGLTHIYVGVPGSMRRGDLVVNNSAGADTPGRTVSRISHFHRNAAIRVDQGAFGVSLASRANTGQRTSSGKACHRQPDTTGKSSRLSQSWHGAATLNTRKWFHLSCSRERDQGRGAPYRTCSIRWARRKGSCTASGAAPMPRHKSVFTLAKVMLSLGF